MNSIISFLIQIALTLAFTFIIVGYLRPCLRTVLTDLCKTVERAQFWTAFSNVLLIGMPVIFALNYKPEAAATEELFFEVASKLSGNLGGFLFALVAIGLVVSFFALVAPRPNPAESK
jgi:hypothetical protein